MAAASQWLVLLVAMVLATIQARPQCAPLTTSPPSASPQSRRDCAFEHANGPNATVIVFNNTMPAVVLTFDNVTFARADGSSSIGGFAFLNLPNNSFVAFRGCQIAAPIAFGANNGSVGAPSNAAPPLHGFVLVVEDLVATGIASYLSVVTQHLANATVNMSRVVTDAQHVLVITGHDSDHDTSKVLVGVVEHVQVALRLVRHTIRDVTVNPEVLQQVRSLHVFNLATLRDTNVTCHDVVFVGTGGLYRTWLVDVEAVLQEQVAYMLWNVSFTVLLYANEDRAFLHELLWVQAEVFQNVNLTLLHVHCRIECVNTRRTGCESGFLRIGGVIGQPQQGVIRGLLWLVLDDVRLDVLGTGATCLFDFDAANAGDLGTEIRLDVRGSAIRWTLKGPLDAVTMDTFAAFKASISTSSTQLARDGSIINLARLHRARAVVVNVSGSTFETAIFLDANIAPTTGSFSPLIFTMSFLLAISNVTDLVFDVTHTAVSSLVVQGPSALCAFLSHSALVNMLMVLAATVEMERCAIRIAHTNFTVFANITPATVRNSDAELMAQFMGDITGIAAVALQTSLISLDLSCCKGPDNFSVVAEGVVANVTIAEATAHALRATGSGVWVGGAMLVGPLFQRLQLQGIRLSFVRYVIEESFGVSDVGVHLSNMRARLHNVRIDLQGSSAWLGLLTQYPRATDVVGAVAVFCGVALEANVVLDVAQTDVVMLAVPNTIVPNGCVPGSSLVGYGGAVGFSPSSALQPAAMVCLFATHIGGTASQQQPATQPAAFSVTFAQASWLGGATAQATTMAAWQGLPLLVFNDSSILNGATASVSIVDSMVAGVARSVQPCTAPQPWRLVRGSPTIHKNASMSWAVANVTIQTVAIENGGGAVAASAVDETEGAALFDFVSPTTTTPETAGYLVDVVAASAASTRMLSVAVRCTTWDGVPIPLKRVGVKRTHLNNNVSMDMLQGCPLVDLSFSRTLAATSTMGPPGRNDGSTTTTAMRAATGATVAVVMGGSLAGTGAMTASAIHLQSTVAALLMAARCQTSGDPQGDNADQAADTDTAVGASFTDNPTLATIPTLGPMLQHAGGAVFANMGLVAGMAILVSVTTWLWDVVANDCCQDDYQPNDDGGHGRPASSRWHGRASLAAAVAMIPGSGASAFAALLQSSVGASVSLMMAPWRTAPSIGVGVVGLAAFVGGAGAAGWYILHDFPLVACGRQAPRRPSVRASCCRRFWYCFDAITMDRTEWCVQANNGCLSAKQQPQSSSSSNRRASQLVQRMLPFFSAYKPRNACYFMFEYSVAMVGGLLSALSGEPAFCGACQWALVAFCAVSLGVSLWRAPCTSTFENGTLYSQNVLTLLIASLAAAASSWPEAGATAAVAEALTILQCALTLAAVVIVALLVGCRRLQRRLGRLEVTRSSESTQQFFAFVDARRRCTQLQPLQRIEQRSPGYLGAMQALSELVAAICADRSVVATAAAAPRQSAASSTTTHHHNSNNREQ